MPIYISPLVTEIGNIIENKGTDINDLMRDNILTEYDNIQYIQAQYNLDYTFFYEFGWKSNIENAPNTWINLEGDILNNVNNRRIIAFKNFLSQPKNNIEYGISITENTISRDSTILNDNIMLLCFQFAFIDHPNIGGYYGHTAPVFNNFKQLTHPEICLFNSIDYLIKFVKNAKYTNCKY